MIWLTRLNKQGMVLNTDLIKWIESSPDTVITLITGEKLVVVETCDEIVRAMMKVRRQCEDPSPAARALYAFRQNLSSKEGER